MSTKSDTHTRCGTLRNHQFPQGGMLKFTYKGWFLTIKIAYEKFLDWKSKHWKHALVPPLHVEIFIFENTKISILSGISKFRLWTDFGKSWQFWVDFAALRVAESMPEAFKTS
jgi:hypothetical protein